MNDRMDGRLAADLREMVSEQREYRELLSQRSWLESKTSAGGTATGPLGEQLEQARAALDADPSV